MAVYKARMPTGHLGKYKVRMPTGHQGKYKVAIGYENITIDMTGAPPDVEWSLEDSGGEVATGATSMPATMFPTETYTLIWLDTAFPYTPPPPEGPTVLSVGSPIVFGPP
jgi:hypothetical protein